MNKRVPEQGDSHPHHHDVLGKSEYQKISERLNFRSNPWCTLGVLLLDFALLGIATWLLGKDTIAGYLIAQVLLAIIFFHNFLIVHECGHGSFSKDKTFNNVLGHLVSLFCFIPYYSWVYIHAEHHALAGNIDKDPVLKLIREYNKADRVKSAIIRFAWKSWIPILALLQQTVYWGFPIVLARRDGVRTRKFRNSAFSVTLLVLVYAYLALNHHSWFNFSTFGPALVFYLMAIELINFPHHMEMPTFKSRGRKDRIPIWQQHAVTRSVYYPSIISELFILNFNFHIEHHMFPTLPWYNLRKARNIIHEELNENYNETKGVGWNIRARQKDPAEVFLASRETDWYVDEE